MKKVKRIYCKDCIHQSWDDCHYNPTITYDPVNGEELTYKECRKKNRNMDCKEFKEKGFWGKCNSRM